MQQGLFFPAFDGVADPHRLVELAQIAESAGWDGVFLWDHLLYSGGVTKILDPYISLAAIASATSTIQLGAMVTPLNRRRPQVVARPVSYTHLEWAIASFELVYPASFTAEVWFQDGGGMGIFNKVGSGKWFMIGSPIVPYCGEGLPSVVVHLWQFNIYPGCA